MQAQLEFLKPDQTISYRTQQDFKSAQSEQIEYQQDVFRAMLRWVLIVCSILSIAYFVPFVQQSSFPALVVSVTFISISFYSGFILTRLSIEKFTRHVRLWLAMATWTVFAFGFMQPVEFMHIAAMGGIIVLMIAVFLEPGRLALRWAVLNIGSYVISLLLRNVIHVPPFDLGILHDLVFYVTPFAIFIILAVLGRVTTQHFKDNLIKSESRRRQLEVQGVQLRELAQQADAAREKAEQSDHIKSAFLASMSHELRTPLNSVINFTRFVADGDTGEINEQQKELLTEVIDSAHHLLNLINDVLDISKIEAGGLNLFIEDDVDITQIVKNVSSVGRSLIMEKPVALETLIEPDILPIRADRQRVLQVLLNIMSNACKFTDAGSITTRVACQNNEIVISIADTGPGIPIAEQEAVFQAFKQTQVGLRRGNGTGLGMPIARSLTEAHGGRLWLESEPGKGSTFFVSLPVKSEYLVPTLA